MPQRSCTVLISSRTGELGSSRRAAFRAVHDEGWTPLLYETEPSEWLLTNSACPLRNSDIKITAAAENARISMERLIENADYFIGIYGTSLGDPSPILSGLRPLEFEFLYFLTKAAWRGKRRKLPQGTNLLDCYRARADLRKMFVQIRAASSKCQEIFQQRMAMFLKANQTDDPTSSLMYSTLLRISPTLSSGPVRLFTSSVDGAGGGYGFYRRPSSRLYTYIREQIASWKTNTPRASRTATASKSAWISVVSEEHVGALLEIVKFAFDTGYNVSRINMGLDRAKKRVVGLEVSPFWGANREFYRRLKERYKGRISYCKPELIGHKWKGSAWKLQVVVADRPGMVVRILTALALLGQKVLSVAIGDREKESKFLRELDLAEIDLIFQKGSKKCKFDLRAVMAELASSPGVYAVRPCGEITAAR